MAIGDRFRVATPDEAAADPELAGAQAQMAAIEEAARKQFAGQPHMLDLVQKKGREHIANLLDEGKEVGVAAPGRRDRER
jgi:hypothetical protein